MNDVESRSRRQFLTWSGKGVASGFVAGAVTGACSSSGADTAEPVAQGPLPPVEDDLPGGVPALSFVRDVVRDYGADPTGASDSIAAIQLAIDDLWAGGGGTVCLPGGLFSIGAPIVPRSGVSIVGVRPAPAYTHSCVDLGIDARNGSGTWLQPTQFGAGISGIEFNTSPLPAHPDPLLQDVPVSNVLIASLGFLGFDHGIRAGGPNHRSFGFGRLEDLMFLGKAGGTVHTRTALHIENFQHTRIDHIKVWHCQNGINLINSHTPCAGGNSLILEPYVYMSTQPGESGRFGIRLAVEGPGSLHLNMLNIIRPQVNWFFDSPPRRDTVHLAIEGGDNPVAHCEISGIDVEGAADTQVLVRRGENMLLTLAAATRTESATESVLLDRGSGVIVSHTPHAIVNTIDSATALNWTLHGVCHHVRGSGIRGQYYERTGLDRQSPNPTSVTSLGAGNGSSNIRIRTSDIDGAPRIEGRMLQAMPTVTAQDGATATQYWGHRVICAFDNQDIWPQSATDRMRDMEYLFIKSHPGPVGIRIRARAGDTLSGADRLDLVAQWSFARLYCAGPGTWVVLENTGTAV